MPEDRRSGNSPLKWTVGSLLAGALGFALTSLLPHADPAPAGDSPVADVAPSRPASAASAPPEAKASTLAPQAPLRSSDTLDELLALDDFALYDRLALWLLDAPAEAMADFWEKYSQRPGRDSWITDLLFSQWTRLDPQGALASARGSGAEGACWWAWALNDPQAAVAAVKGGDPSMAAYVLRAIGQFHPHLAQKIFEENPEFGEPNGLEGIAYGIGRDDPQAALEFLRQHGVLYHEEQMERWAKDDPHAAFQWLLENRQLLGPGKVGESFLSTLERQHPELLSELAAAAPPGELKRNLEARAFQRLAEEKPDEALAQARSATPPRIAAERLAQVGRTLVRSDPQRALEVFRELLALRPDGGMAEVPLVMPGGSASTAFPLAGLSELTEELMGKAPEAAMAIADAVPSPGDGDASPQSMARLWLIQDSDGFTAWLEDQPAGLKRDQNASLLAAKLTEQGDYQEALDWATGIADATTRDNALPYSFAAWARQDPQAARAWLARPEVTDQVRQQLQPYAGDSQ